MRKRPILDRAFESLDELLWTLGDADIIPSGNDAYGDGEWYCRVEAEDELCRGACEASGCLKAKRDRALALMKEIDPSRKRVGDENYWDHSEAKTPAA